MAPSPCQLCPSPVQLVRHAPYHLTALRFPQLALALKCTLYGVLLAVLYKIIASRFDQRLKALDYDFETFCRALKVMIDNKAVIEVRS